MKLSPRLFNIVLKLNSLELLSILAQELFLNKYTSNGVKGVVLVLEIILELFINSVNKINPITKDIKTLLNIKNTLSKI